MDEDSTDVDAYLTALVSRLDAELGRELVACWVTGSLALGGYQPGRSDIDVVAVVRTEPDRPTRSELVERLRHRSLPCPSRGLEFVLYAEPALRRPSTSPDFVLELNDGPSLPFVVHLDPAERAVETGAFWYVLDRSMLRDAGRTLLGPAPAELLAPLPRASILAALAESVAWHRNAGATDDAVLNGCRALRWARSGRWSSKPAAARWLLEHTHIPVVLAALDARLGGPPCDRDDVAEFLGDVGLEMAAATVRPT